MPKLLRLSGKQVVEILQRLGFEIITVRGSHFQLSRLVNEAKQNITVPVHGKDSLPIGTLKNIYRDVVSYIGEDKARELFYG